MANYGNSISNIESGGRYDLMGPAVHGGDRAIGKYQVMASNVPEWTRAALGTAMTPDQFRNSPAAQEIVFRHRFGKLRAEIRPGGRGQSLVCGRGRHEQSWRQRCSMALRVSGYGERSRRFMQGLD